MPRYELALALMDSRPYSEKRGRDHSYLSHCNITALTEHEARRTAITRALESGSFVQEIRCLKVRPV